MFHGGQPGVVRLEDARGESKYPHQEAPYTLELAMTLAAVSRVRPEGGDEVLKLLVRALSTRAVFLSNSWAWASGSRR